MDITFIILLITLMFLGVTVIVVYAFALYILSKNDDIKLKNLR